MDSSIPTQENFKDYINRPFTPHAACMAGGSKLPEESHTHLLVTEPLCSSCTLCHDIWGHVRRHHSYMFTNHPRQQRWYLALLGKLNPLPLDPSSPRITLWSYNTQCRCCNTITIRFSEGTYLEMPSSARQGLALPAFSLPL